MMRPVVYPRNERYVGFSLKFWPREVDDLIREEERFTWVRSDYS